MTPKNIIQHNFTKHTGSNSDKGMLNVNIENVKKNEINPTNSVNNLPDVASHHTYVNYWDAETSKKIQNSTMSVYEYIYLISFFIFNSEYENKLVDDILQPTGITIKPSDSQINEFLKRLKSLDKKLIGKILYEKISNFENLSNQAEIKILTVIRIFFIKIIL